MIRENERRTIVLAEKHFASQRILEPHARKYFVCSVRAVQCSVYTPPSLAKDSLLPVSESLESENIFKEKSAPTTLAILKVATMTWKTTTKK